MRPTPLLPPYNRRHLRSSFPPPPSNFLFLLVLFCPRLRESFPSSTFPPPPPSPLFFLIFLLHLSQGRLHPRRWKLFTRHSEHAPSSRPRSRPSPPAFRSGLPFATLTRCPRLIALALALAFALALIGHAAATGQGRVASANSASSFSRRGMEKSPTSSWGPPSCTLPTTMGKHRPISRRFS